MVIIAKSALKTFIKYYPDAEQALENWYEIIKQNDWKNFNEMKTSFNTADSVGNGRYVFNIKGNEYRLVADIEYKIGIVFIVWIGTHKEYDKKNIKEIKYVKGN